MTKLKRVLIAAGGTGGHIFPGLAIADVFRQQGVDVQWMGTQKGMEKEFVSRANIPLHFISIGGLRGKGIKDLLLGPARIVIALLQSIYLLHRYKPDVVIGMGGYVSGPVGLASWMLGIPLVIHEQNARAGTANKCLFPFANKVLEGFPHTFSSKKVVMTGNPVRAEMVALPTPKERLQARSGQPWRLLVLGGSLGAAAINEIVPRALSKLPPDQRPEVYHQTGDKFLEMTLTHYQLAGVQAKVVPFIREMDKAYAWADVVLCRAGALTIAELCGVGIGAILVPFPYAVDDHQTANATYMADHQAAIIVQQSALTDEMLVGLLSELGASETKRIAMAEAAYALRQVDAANKVQMICEEICS